MPDPGATPARGPVLAATSAIFRAIVTTVVPDARTLDPDAWRQLEAIVDGALASRPPAMHRQLRILLRVVQWAPVLRFGRRFTALDDARRTRFLATLQDRGPKLLRVGGFGLRTLALIGFYGRPAAAEAIGYRPDARGWEAAP